MQSLEYPKFELCTAKKSTKSMIKILPILRLNTLHTHCKLYSMPKISSIGVTSYDSSSEKKYISSL